MPTAHTDTFARDHLPPADRQPVFTFSLPELQFPAQLNCATELLDRHVLEGRGDRLCVQGSGERWTYRDLQQRANRIAHVLTRDMGLVAGNRLLLRGANSPMMAACFLAGLKAGLVMVPTMPLLRAAELHTVMDKAQVSAALCASNLADELTYCLDATHPQHTPCLTHVMPFGGAHGDRLEHLMAQYTQPFQAHPTTRDDVCLIAFTSGTTGSPKGTMHFHRDVMAMCDLFPRHVLHMTPKDVVCGTPPIAFTFGLGGLLAFPLRYGASTVLLEKHSPETLLQTIAKYKATQCYTAPHLLPSNGSAGAWV